MKRSFGVDIQGGLYSQTRIKHGGFTIIELMIATMVFSVILLVVTTGIIRIGNIYYKGITSSKTQDVARDIMNDLSSTVQFSTGSKTTISDGTTSGSVTKFCIGDTRYTGFIDTVYDSNNVYSSGLVSEQLVAGDCGTTSTDCTSVVTTNCITHRSQLLGNKMRVLVIDAYQDDPANPSLWNVAIRIAYGDSDLLDYSNGLDKTNCKLGKGSSFCAVAALDTLVNKRVQ